MKYGSVLAVMAFVVTFLSAVPAANAQPEPPEGWTAFQLQNVLNFQRGNQIVLERNMCQEAMISNPGRYSNWCGQLGNRYRSGQIAEMQIQAMRHRMYEGTAAHWNPYFGSYGYHGTYGGHYGSYWPWQGGFWREMRDPLIVGLATQAGVSVVNGVLNKKKHADEEKTERERMLLEHGVHPEQQKAQARNGRQSETQAQPVPESRQSRVPVVHDPTYGGQRRKSLINATGCVVGLLEANGDEQFVNNGKEVLLTAFTGLQWAIVQGECTKGVFLKLNSKGTIGILTCGLPPGSVRR